MGRETYLTVLLKKLIMMFEKINLVIDYEKLMPNLEKMQSDVQF